MAENKYQTLRKSRLRKQLNETNDCSVIAIAIACRIPYKTAHEMCADAGRRVRGRFHTLRALDGNTTYSVTNVENLRQKTGSKYTPKTIGERLKRGYYLAFTRTHVLAVVNGEVHDWTDGRKHHIYAAYKITRTRA